MPLWTPGTGETWPAWNALAAQNTATSAATNTVIWQTWQGQINDYAIGGTNQTAGTITTANQAWNQWNSIRLTNTAAGTTLGTWQFWNQQAPAIIHRETREETEARVAAELRAVEARKIADAERKLAADRARKLLIDHLTDEQRKEMLEKRHFHLRSRSGRLFRVMCGTGRHGNIKEIVGDRIVRSICVAPSGDIPEDDAILGQKLALEHAEEELFRYANVTELRPAA